MRPFLYAITGLKFVSYAVLLCETFNPNQKARIILAPNNTT